MPGAAIRTSENIVEIQIAPDKFQGTIIQTREVSGLRLVEGLYAANSKIPNHSHPHAVFCTSLRGICSEVYAGKLRQYEAFSAEFLPPYQNHSLTFPHAGTRAFSVEVSSKWLDSARDYSLRPDSSVFCHRGSLSSLFLKLYKEFRLRDEASHLAIEGLILEMLADVSRRQKSESDHTTPLWLAKARELLHERFSERLTIIDVATAVGIHPVHLSREFRRFHRCTIGEYIRELRLEQACRKLAESNESLAAIASGAGFADQSHFSRIFKRLTGTTPAKYRAAFSKH